MVCHNKVQENRFKGEKTLLEKYETVENLINDLEHNQHIFTGSRNSGSYIHHLKEDINFYIGDFLNKCPPEKIMGVICTETLQQDMKMLFDIDVSSHRHKNKRYDKSITKSATKKLRSYLSKDYSCIDKIFEMSCITEEKYNLLSK